MSILGTLAAGALLVGTLILRAKSEGGFGNMIDNELERSAKSMLKQKDLSEADREKCTMVLDTVGAAREERNQRKQERAERERELELDKLQRQAEREIDELLRELEE